MKLHLLAAFILLFACNETNSYRLQEIDVRKIEFAKPSGIYYSIFDTAFYVANQEGILAKCDTSFKIIFANKFDNLILSHLFVDEFFIFTVSRKDILKIDKRNLEIKERQSLSKFNSKFSEIKGIYFNPIRKTFDAVVLKKNTVFIFHLSPINFNKIKASKITNVKSVDCSFQNSKYLYFVDNKRKSIRIFDLTLDFKEIKTLTFIAPEIVSGTFAPPNFILLLSAETRRTFKYKF